MARFVAIVVACFVAPAACHLATEPSFPSAAVRIDAPKVYGLWWQLTESCATRTGDMSRVTWYTVPGTDKINIGGRAVDGYWFPSTRRILLAEKAIYAGQLVRHEMLHALTGSIHQREYFIDRCDGVVACVGSCLTDAGGPLTVAAGAPVMPLSELAIGVTVQPDTASLSQTDGWVAITVSARNSRAADAWAQLEPIAGNPSASATFGYAITCESACDTGNTGGYDYVMDAKFAFPALHDRRLVFDEHVGAGHYAVQGIFNTDSAPVHKFLVTP